MVLLPLNTRSSLKQFSSKVGRYGKIIVQCVNKNSCIFSLLRYYCYVCRCISLIPRINEVLTRVIRVRVFFSTLLEEHLLLLPLSRHQHKLKYYHLRKYSKLSHRFCYGRRWNYMHRHKLDIFSLHLFLRSTTMPHLAVVSHTVLC